MLSNFANKLKTKRLRINYFAGKPIIAVHMQCEISVATLQENIVKLILIGPGNN